MDRFLDAVTTQLHRHIHHPDFKHTLLQSVLTSWRFQISSDVNTQIETETRKWEETRVDQIYEDNFIQNFNDKLKIDPLPKNLKTGFKMNDDQENKIFSRVLFSTITIVGGLAFFQQPVVGSIAIIGVSIAVRHIADFRTVCEKAIDVRIKIFSKLEIKRRLRERYAIAIKMNVEKVLKTMKVEIEKLTKEKIRREKENTNNTSNMRLLKRIDTKVSESRERLEDITRKCPPQVIDTLTVF